ncbi:hypothetical protein [Chryseobacterium gambrini]|uniref:hypothetical protein n=1 Tax=Chryseobacterium gambrini TaxID=373672 RepID=UPI0022F3CE95|nr:hypothetical protein [Chryseobacterium gambrini]WBX96679.1 hypothetical protein PE065_17785 [Chryseobacterium gambrini]
MKKFILLFLGILLFDILYVFIYDQFFIGIKPEFLQYPLSIIKVLVNSPAVLFDKLLPFYASIPIYKMFLIFFGNILVQTFLIYRMFFKKRRSTENEK